MKMLYNFNLKYKLLHTMLTKEWSTMSSLSAVAPLLSCDVLFLSYFLSKTGKIVDEMFALFGNLIETSII